MNPVIPGPEWKKELVSLNLVPGVGWKTLCLLLEHFGTPADILDAPVDRLMEVPGVGKVTAERLAAVSPDEAEREIEKAEKEGVDIFTPAEFPAGLLNVHSPPILLYVKGRLLPEDGVSVALVGARRCTAYGANCARRLARGLAFRGVTVVSGLARGIDTAAHRGALEGKGRTLAVLGCGLDRIYPPENASLAEEIIENGALLSEFPLGSEPSAAHFPRRNRIISGLSLGVVVVEASPRSGSLITARWALEQGREVFAVPGRIDSPCSRGTHALIKEGAKLVENVDDILEELGVTMHSSGGGPVDTDVEADAVSSVPSLTWEEESVLKVLSRGGPMDADAIVERTGMDVADVQATLTMLEMKHLVESAGGRFALRE